MLGGLGSLGPMVIECYETIPAGISAKDQALLYWFTNLQLVKPHGEVVVSTRQSVKLRNLHTKRVEKQRVFNSFNVTPKNEVSPRT